MSVKKNTLLNLLGAIVPLLIGIVTIPIYLHYLGIERYGALTIMWSLLGYFGFLDFGLGKAVTQRMSKLSEMTDSDRSNLLWTAIITSLLIGYLFCFLLWALSGLIFGYLINDVGYLGIETSIALKWIVLGFPFLLTIPIFQGALHARMRFYELNIIQILGNGLVFLVPLAFAAGGYIKLQTLVLVTLAIRLLTIIIYYQKCQQYVPLMNKPTFSLKHIKPLMEYGTWVSVLTFLVPLTTSIDRLLIASISGIRTVANYTLPFDLVSKGSLIPVSLSSSIFPKLASANEDDAKKVAFGAMLTLKALMTPTVIVALLVVHPFLLFWTGDHFVLSMSYVAEILLLGIWINSLAVPHHARLLAANKTKSVVIIYLAETPIYLMLLWFGVKSWGAVGAAAAWSLRILIDTSLILMYSGVLRPTLSVVMPAIIYISSAYILSLWTDIHSPYRWSIGLFALLLSLNHEKRLILRILRKNNLNEDNL